MDKLRVRLIQVRHLPHIEEDEQRSFLERCKLRPDQLLTTNVLFDRLHDGLLEDVDAVMIGGAGAHTVTQTYEWTGDLVSFVGKIDDLDLPLFGSCWGHQFIAFAYGGKVIYDVERSEIGSGWVDLTDIGARDPLFRDFPKRFRANMGHHDRVSVLPESAEEVATNQISPYQAFRIKGKPIYGTQFHSELDAEAVRGRLFAYRHLYPEMGDDRSFDRLVNTLAETTEVDGLLELFLRRTAIQEPVTSDA
jgi:GMP synthase (glutamine-hydrolysing)